MEKFTSLSEEKGLNLKATELRLGLPGCESPEREGLFISGAKRVFSDVGSGKWVFTGSEKNAENGSSKQSSMVSPKAVGEKKPFGSAAKAQVVGWPPIRSFRKNSMVSNAPKNNADTDNKSGSDCLYVKVSMDGAPYLRKVDLKTYKSYTEMSSALEKMFSCFTIGQCGSHGGPGREGLNESRLMDLIDGSEYVLTYEDKDGDWMLVGDVPWIVYRILQKDEDHEKFRRGWASPESDREVQKPQVDKYVFCKKRTEQAEGEDLRILCTINVLLKSV